MPTHTQSCNCSSFSVSSRFILLINLTNQLSGDISFIFPFRIYRTIYIPAGKIPIRTNQDQLKIICILLQYSHLIYPAIIAIAITMQEVYRRKAFFFFIIIRNDNHRLYLLFHCSTIREHRIYLRRKST
ncbi:hypothetical protein D3C86_1542070 [compost metagenome]